MRFETPEAESLLTKWLASPRADRGMRFRRRDGWDFWSYHDLSRLAGAHARRLMDAGAREGDVVGLALTAGPGFVGAFFGTWLVGATPAPLPAPSIIQSTPDYISHLAGILKRAAPRAIYADERSREPVTQAAVSADLAQPPAMIDATLAPLGALQDGSDMPPRVAVLQFTSGTTTTPRRVELSRRNLTANVAMIRRWLDIGEHDATATWLPLYHDMGLIGCLLTPMSAQNDIFMMRPEQFIRRPLDWLRCFGAHGATMTAIPNFALRILLQSRRRDRDGTFMGSLDFSRWKALIVGAERLDAAAMAELAAWLQPHGFDTRALLPAYGLAEATLAVTGSAPRATAGAVAIDSQQLRVGGRIEVRRRDPIDTDPTRFSDDNRLVGCGIPLEGVNVEIIDDAGQPLPPEHLGEITVTGPTVASTTRVSPDTPAGESVLRTGDLGFVSERELFVLGRRDDRVELTDVLTHLDELETILARLPHAPTGRFVCLVDPATHTRVTLVAERPHPDWLDHAELTLRIHLGDDTSLRIVAAESGTILRTTSGKPRRNHMWDQLASRRSPFRYVGGDQP